MEGPLLGDEMSIRNEVSAKRKVALLQARGRVRVREENEKEKTSEKSFTSTGVRGYSVLSSLLQIPEGRFAE